MKYLMLGLEVSKFNVQPFIIDASNILSVSESGDSDTIYFKIEMKGTKDVYYCTHFYDEPAFSRITDIPAFYDMLKEL